MIFKNDLYDYSVNNWKVGAYCDKDHWCMCIDKKSYIAPLKTHLP